MIQNLSRLMRAGAEEGAFVYSPIQKSSIPNPSAGAWADLSMGAGTPKFNAYVGSQATATPLFGQRNDSIYAGEPIAGRSKYLHSIMMQTATANGAPNRFVLCDYVMAYPLIDLDSTDLQEMDNTLSLPRYTSGAGLQLFAVVTTPMATSATATVNYTDSAGNAASVTASLVGMNVTGGLCSSSGTVATAGARSPFFPIANGIRSLNSVQLSASAGGFAAFVICRPLAELQMYEVGVPAENEYFRQKAQAPEILDGAYLNFLNLQGGTSAPVPLNGLIEFYAA